MYLSVRCMQWSHKCTADDSVAHAGGVLSVMHNDSFDLVRVDWPVDWLC